MPELTEQEERELRLKLAADYPPEQGPYRVEEESTGHQVTVPVVRPGQKVLDGEPALDESGRYRAPVHAQPKPAKKAAASGSKES